MSRIDPHFIPWPEAEQQRYRQAGYWLGKPLGDLLRQSADACPERVAVIDGKGAWRYRELDEAASRLAAGLSDQGLNPGDRVVLQWTNDVEWIQLLFALFRLGVAPVLALPNHRYPDIHYFCEQVGAVAYLAPSSGGPVDYRDIGDRLVQAGVIQRALIARDAKDAEPPLADWYGEGRAIAEPEASGIALFQLSGGTTGRSKLIARTHDDYYYSVRASALVCGLSHATVYLAVLPIAHNFPLSSPGVLGVLWAGGTLVLSHSGAPELAFPLIERHRVTMTAMVPPLLQSWLNAGIGGTVSTRPDLSSLSLIQVGGAKLNEAVARRVEPELGSALQQVFGMAEGLVNYTRLDDDRETVLTTQGRPLSQADEVRIVDESDRPVPRGETGLLLTRGPYTIRGYYNAAEHNERSFTRDGFYRTGDRVRLTDSGHLVVEGRAKDQINRGGEKIAADEVENHLLAHPDVVDAALVAVPDPYLGERSCACLVLKPDVQLDRRSLRRFLRQRELTDYKMPDRYEQLEILPKTRLGKVDKAALRARFQPVANPAIG